MAYRLLKPSIEYFTKIKDFREQLLIDNHWDGTTRLSDFEDIEKWYLDCLLYEKQETCPPMMSISFQYIYVDENDDIVGMINYRPNALSHPNLKKYGGHIGYSVAPNSRKMGVGTNMLKDMLQVCRKDSDIEKVLVTCFSDNEGSRKVILNNGGVYESSIDYPPENKILERYWITL